jgi:glycerophosphoryl diester phosphodiesterase
LRVTERFDHKTSQPRYPRRFPGGQGSFRLQTLEEELQLIQGLNKSTGRNAGIYPEIKAPAWHRKQGQDISKIVLEVLSRFGYKTKADKIYLQCFDFEEVKRIRNELGYQGKLIQLLTDNAAGESATDYDFLRTRQGLEEVAKVADGIGPALQQVVTGKGKERLQVTDLVKNAHAAKLEVHPYTFRADDLPAYAGSLEELLGIFFLEGGVDGVFTDHTDRAVAFLRAVNSSNRKK